MRELLMKLREKTLSLGAEAKLYALHQQHFKRRVSPLGSAFYPGGEKSEQGIASLGNGAYASFRNEPLYEGRPAFIHTVERALPPTGFLYYWRASATIEYLRREGSEDLRLRLNILRNVRIHLRSGFTEVGKLRGEVLWAPRSWAGRPAARDERDVTGVRINLENLRGKKILEAIFAAAEVPLTRGELAEIWLRSAGGGWIEAPESAEAPSPLEIEEIAASVHGFFFHELNALERDLLLARGYAEDGRPAVSFRDVAARLKGKKAESYRLMEKAILERFRERFGGAGEIEIAIAALVRLLGLESTRCGQKIAS